MFPPLKPQRALAILFSNNVLSPTDVRDVHTVAQGVRLKELRTHRAPQVRSPQNIEVGATPSVLCLLSLHELPTCFL